MELCDVLLQAGLLSSFLIAYLMFRRKPNDRGNYRNAGWNYPLKYLRAKLAVKSWKAKIPQFKEDENPRAGLDELDGITLRTSAPDGTILLLGVRRVGGIQPVAEVTVYLKLPDGTAYKYMRHPDTAVGAWESTGEGWSAGGLKIQVLEPKIRLRILFNGLLTRERDNVTQHVKMNLIWCSASEVVRHPTNWSDELAAHSLALEPWLDDQWHCILDKQENCNWLQWGAIQGRFTSYDERGSIDVSEYLRVRGVKERGWNPQGYTGLMRVVNIMAMASDGTGVQLRGVSYKGVLTKCMYGCVRFPNYEVQSVTSTDLEMEDFCESSDAIPNVYVLHVGTQRRALKLVLRVDLNSGGKLYSGVPYQQETELRSMAVSIDEYCGSGILELGYEATVQSSPQYRLAPRRTLRWLDEQAAGSVGYCVEFEARAAACTNYVGGKGASLSLLASVQDVDGYKVPPGFCLTVRALENHLAVNPAIKQAILAIEAANANYQEADFKAKCARRPHK